MTLDLTLEHHEVLDYVQGKVVEPLSNAPAAAKMKYRKGEIKAKKILVDSIQNHLVAYISDLGTSKEIYDKLIGMFKVNNANQILFLKNKLKDIKMGKGEPIQSYFMRITQIKNDLLSIGEVTDDRELTLIALGGLSRACAVFNTTIFNNDRIPSFNELFARCTQEDTRMMARDKPSNGNEPTAYSTHAKKKNNVGPRRQGQGFTQRCAEKEGVPIVTGSTTILESVLTRRTLQEMMTTTTTKAMEIKGTTTLSTTSPLDTLDHWLIDSGASRHFTGYKEVLSNLVEKKTNLEIILGDNATYPMKGIGIVTLHLNQGQTIHLQEVLYVPDLKKNLVSISTMEDKGFQIAVIDGKVRIWQRNPKDAFTLALRVEGLWQVEGSPLGALTCDVSLQSELWHQRFTHLHYKALPGVSKMVTGMPDFNMNHEGVCQRCAAGKLTRELFPSSESQTTDILQFVHSDLSGMLLLTSLGGYLYYAIFVDDFSRKT
eukprot:PITA_26306